MFPGDLDSRGFSLPTTYSLDDGLSTDSPSTPSSNSVSSPSCNSDVSGDHAPTVSSVMTTVPLMVSRKADTSFDSHVADDRLFKSFLTPMKPRTSRACDKCRERKTKCTGGEFCVRCQQRGLVCTYSPREQSVRKGRRSPHPPYLQSELQTQSHSSNQQKYSFLSGFGRPTAATRSRMSTPAFVPLENVQVCEDFGVECRSSLVDPAQYPEERATHLLPMSSTVGPTWNTPPVDMDTISQSDCPSLSDSFDMTIDVPPEAQSYNSSAAYDTYHSNLQEPYCISDSNQYQDVFYDEFSSNHFELSQPPVPELEDPNIFPTSTSMALMEIYEKIYLG